MSRRRFRNLVVFIKIPRFEDSLYLLPFAARSRNFVGWVSQVIFKIVFLNARAWASALSFATQLDGKILSVTRCRGVFFYLCVEIRTGSDFNGNLDPYSEFVSGSRLKNESV